MTVRIELTAEEKALLEEQARAHGRGLEQHIHLVLLKQLERSASSRPEEWLDREAVAACEREADDTVTLEQVRAGTSDIKDSMARVVVEEVRVERF